MHLPEPLRSEVTAHYDAFIDRLSASFHGIALIPTYMPEGLDGPVTRSGALDERAPASVASVLVPHEGGARRYLALTPDSLLWAVHRYAVGFESWTPRLKDPLTPAYARILLVPRAQPRAQLAAAADLMLAALQDTDLDVAILTDGHEIALWIPLKSHVAYPDLRVVLHGIARTAAQRSEGLLDDGLNGTAPVRISVRTNAPLLGSSLPYTIIARTSELRVLLPTTHKNLAAALTAPHDLKAAASFKGDPFRATVKRIGPQRLPNAPHMFTFAGVPMYEPRAPLITASIEILSDGHPRAAEQILAELHRRGIKLPGSADRKYVYIRLKDYIERTTARGRKPALIQDPDRRFRINHAPDTWPPQPPAREHRDPADLLKRLGAASSGKDSVAFEKTVCEAFEYLGFMVTHVGGNAAPDGYFDAPLGSLAYRVMLECKTSEHPLQRPDVYEASKYRDAYKAQCCALVGPAFGDTAAIVNEANTHGVCVWSVDDLAGVIQAGLNPSTIRTLFEPGVVEDRLADLTWDLAHGFTRRIRLVCELIKVAGWNAQRRAAIDGRASEAPRLTVDAAMFLVNEALSAAGADRAASRVEVEAAFSHLADPLVGEAVRLDGTDGAIVIVEGRYQ